MSHKKSKKYDEQYRKQYNMCKKDAIDIVKQWFDDANLVIDPSSIYIVWFAFIRNGYHCMMASKIYTNNFFEIVKNVKTNEMTCFVFQRIECIAHPSEKPDILEMPNNIQEYLD